MLAALLGACSDKEPTTPPPTTSATAAAHTPDTSAPTPAPAPADPKIMAELEGLRSRQACNRVTGCSLLSGLMRHGAALVEPARQMLARASATDGYWTIALTEALGQLGAPEAGAVLAPMLADKRWEIQLAAARGLAYLGPKMDEAALLALRTAREKEPLDDAASKVRAALIEHAIARSGRDPRPATAAREALLALFPPAEHGATPHPQLDAFTRLVGDARLPEALPLVRVALQSRNRFVTATALDVAGALQDTGALPIVLALLDDPNPTLRKEAIRALQRITGSRQLIEADQWREWAKTHSLAPVALPPPPNAGPQVLRDDAE
jgi:HEAT repeat protein